MKRPIQFVSFRNIKRAGNLQTGQHPIARFIMQQKKQNLQTPNLFLHARPTKAQREEDAFMQEHGGSFARAVYLIIEAIAACCSAIFAVPFDWLLKAIKYESPLSSEPPKASDMDKHACRSIAPRQRGAASKRYPHAGSLSDTKSHARRRA
jgi:hypothetical protein